VEGNASATPALAARRCFRHRFAGSRALTATVLRSHTDVDVNTGKCKVDGSRAATRIGASATERWANERFRQVMLLVLEFRLEWPNRTLLTDADFEAIRLRVDNALFTATQDGHVGDIYDLNPTIWAIWMAQRAYALKVGGWTVLRGIDGGTAEADF
jgi:hypothetical protein